MLIEQPAEWTTLHVAEKLGEVPDEFIVRENRWKDKIETIMKHQPLDEVTKRALKTKLQKLEDRVCIASVDIDLACKHYPWC